MTTGTSFSFGRIRDNLKIAVALTSICLLIVFSGCAGQSDSSAGIAPAAQTTDTAKITGNQVEFSKTYSNLDSVGMVVCVSNIPESYRADVAVTTTAGVAKNLTRASLPGAPLTLAYSGMDLFSVKPFNTLQFSAPLPEGAVVEVVDANTPIVTDAALRAAFVGIRKRFDISGNQRVDTSDLAMVSAWIQTSRSSDIGVIRARGLEIYPALNGVLATLPATICEDLDGDNAVTTSDIALTMAWIQCGRISSATTIFNRGVEITPLVTVPPTKFPGENVAGVASNLIEITLPGAVKMQFVSIPTGTFRRALTSNLDRKFTITITKPFLMSMTQVTRAQYSALYGSDPSTYRTSMNLPVERLTWDDAADYCNLLSDNQGLERCYTRVGTDTTCNFASSGYRLPTEAEWEYCYRAGTVTDGYWGTDDMGLYCWYSANAAGTPHDVATKLPNAWGLYDMAGNVWGWTNDWWEADYPAMDLTDPTGPATGTYVSGGPTWGRVVPGKDFRCDYWGMYIISGFGVSRNGPSYTNKYDGGYGGYGMRVVRKAP